jgi:hypothetical protein
MKSFMAATSVMLALVSFAMPTNTAAAQRLRPAVIAADAQGPHDQDATIKLAMGPTSAAHKQGGAEGQATQSSDPPPKVHKKKKKKH